MPFFKILGRGLVYYADVPEAGGEPVLRYPLVRAIGTTLALRDGALKDEVRRISSHPAYRTG